MLKKILTLIMIAAMVLPVFGQTQAANPIPTAHGIDVSHHQGVIDWDTVAKHIDFAIIRCGYGSDTVTQDDRQWKANVEACTRLKIPFGVYIYSYATTEEEARSEANHVLRLLKGYSPSMPVYLDLEDDKIANNCSPEQIFANAMVFCHMVESAGYTPGIYANTNWWTNYLTSSQYDKWDRWVARYNSTLNFNRPYSMWQYTSKGSVPGITGDVDMNYWYGTKPGTPCSHSYTFRTKVEPTCTEPGIRLFTCTKCADAYETKLSPKGHAWDKGMVTLEPTETAEGIITYTCSSCGLTKTERIPMLEKHEDNCPSAGYEDVPPFEHWAHEGIDFALKEGLFQGISDTLFAPDKTMTRAMLVTVLWRNAGSPSVQTNDFADVEPGQWYTEAVAWAKQTGIVNGVGEDRFAPMSQITREQLATILYRYAGEPEAPEEDLMRTFPDGESVSEYAKHALSWALGKGLIKGVQSEDLSYLKPQGSATRAQCAAILYRWLYQ